MIFGYARVSTNDQDLSSQLDQLKQAGATKIYREKISGAPATAPNWPNSCDPSATATCCW